MQLQACISRNSPDVLNILPEEVAEELKATGSTTAKYFDNVTVMFTDFVNFTNAGERMTPEGLVDELHTCFKKFDEITAKYNVEKIKTIGDINKGENILITGSTGIGKSYIASALGHHACGIGYKVVYHNVPKLFSKLKMSKADGSYLKEVAKIERQHLLILDDFGMQPFDSQSRAALMELIEDRHGKGALIITSQVPVSKWYEVIGEQTIADAILDRIVHNPHRLKLKGESLRKRRTVNNGLS